MKLFNNPEIKKMFFIQLLFIIAVSVICGFVSLFAGLVSASLGVILLIIQYVGSLKKYNDVEKLCNEIDRILHGDDEYILSGYREGELSILRSEISKMTVRLREQNSALKNEKLFLRDSIADISHQIKTPLTSMNLIISILDKGTPSKREQSMYFRELSSLIMRTEWLINALLKLSQLDAGIIKMNRNRISCNELISASVRPLEISAELKGIEFEYDIETDSCFTGDLSWSGEAVTNILKNCIEHTDIGGKIVISAIENTIYTKIEISDNGCGISEKDLPHIFERFYKAESITKQSFGIGLALAKKIITSQNGVIKAKNDENGGAVFSIIIYHTSDHFKDKK